MENNNEKTINVNINVKVEKDLEQEKELTRAETEAVKEVMTCIMDQMVEIFRKLSSEEEI